jgi:hypothetical protein
MSGEASREEMVVVVLTVALALCFKAGEDYLSEEQVTSRKFTPTEAYSRACLRKLIENKAVEYQWIASTNPLNEDGGLLYLKNPVKEGESHQMFHFEKFKTLLEFLRLAPENQLYIKSLRIDVMAQECVEYAEFYATKSAINLTQVEADNPKLKLMLMELELENVYALIWRSIKMSTRQGHSNKTNIRFSEIIDGCFDKYANSRRNVLNLEKYKRPIQIKPSMISRIADKALTAIIEIYQYKAPRSTDK